MNSVSQALLSADTDETQAYVFESNKLPEIRGASRQLDRLNEQIGELIKNSPNSDLIYAGGGSLLAQVTVAAAPKLVQQIEQLYPQETGVATISAAWRVLPPTSQCFGDVVRWAGHWLRRRKESKESPPFYETLPHQTRCRSCQKRPAESRYLPQLSDWPICHICFAKRETGGIWFSRFEGHLLRHPSLYQAYHQDSSQIEVLIPHTIDEIGQASRPRPGYIALLYLDGDRVGQLLETIQDKEDYRQLSQDMVEATEQAVFTALANHLRPTEVLGSELRQEARGVKGAVEKIFIHPFEIITIGGDDLVLLVPAHAAIPIAMDIGQGFQQEMRGRGAAAGKAEWANVSMSAGVMMADDHTPVQMLVKLAKELLQEAKKLGSQEGGVDFHILKSADMLDDRLDKVRGEYPYTLKQGTKEGGDLSLLSRPYSYTDMNRLWQGLQQVRSSGLATGQMQMLAESLLVGRAEATLFYHYQLKRHGGNPGAGQGYQALDELLKVIAGMSDRNPYPWQEWRQGDVRYRTPLWDIAELYEFVA